MPRALGSSCRCVAVDDAEEKLKSGQAAPLCPTRGCVQVHDSDYVSVYDDVQVHVQVQVHVHVHGDVINRGPPGRGLG